METQGKLVRVLFEATDGEFEVHQRLIPYIEGSKEAMVRLFADIADGQLVHRGVPYIPGHEWTEVPGTRSESGSYFQTIAHIDIPACHPFLDGILPSNVFFDDKEDGITFSQYHNL